MTQTPTINLESLFHLSEMSEEEKMVFLADVGNLIMESATMRFLVESDQTVASQFSQAVDQNADKDNLPELLIKEFPDFGTTLNEEIEAFREESKKLLEG